MRQVSISQLNCMAAASEQVGAAACSPRHRCGGAQPPRSQSLAAGTLPSRQHALGSVQKAHTRSNQSREGLPQHSSGGIDFLSLQTGGQHMGRRLGGVGSAAACAVRAAAQAIFSTRSVSCSRLRLSPSCCLDLSRSTQHAPLAQPPTHPALAAHSPRPPHLLCVWLRP